VDLVERDEDAGAVRGEGVGEGVELRPQASGRCGVRKVEVDPAEAGRQRDPGDAGALAGSLPEAVGEARQLLVGEPVHQAARRRLGHHQPAALRGQSLGLVEHHGLADAAVPREQRRASRRAGPGVQGVGELRDDGVAPGHQRGAGAERRPERAGAPHAISFIIFHKTSRAS
jgi:hypothetical protein